MNARLTLFTAGLVGAMATPCSDWANNGNSCTKGGQVREADDNHQCAGGTCNEDECCGYKCEDYFTQNGGTCGTKQKVNSGHRIYVGITFDYPDKKFSGTIDWTLLGENVKNGCCETTCITAAKATCAGGKVLANENCVFYTGDAVTGSNPSGKVDTCDQPNDNTVFNQDRKGCCETKTCMHTTCNAFGDFNTACKNQGANKCPDCNDLGNKPKATWDKCAACVNVPAADAKCVDCLVCYGSLLSPAVVVTKPAGSGGVVNATGKTSNGSVVVASFVTLSVALVMALFA